MADVFKVSGATQADLIVRAQKTQLYVCRVNDQFCNCVFSDWVKVKVLDIVKLGKKHVPLSFCKVIYYNMVLRGISTIRTTYCFYA